MDFCLSCISVALQGSDSAQTADSALNAGASRKRKWQQLPNQQEEAGGAVALHASAHRSDNDIDREDSSDVESCCDSGDGSTVNVDDGSPSEDQYAYIPPEERLCLDNAILSLKHLL